MQNIDWSTHWLGEVPYAEGIQIQERTRGEVLALGRGSILGLEHPRVITHGIRMKEEEAPLSDIPVFKTNRGGQATLHNNGQLVIYPILPIQNWHWGVRRYVELLLKTTESFLGACNITVVSKNNGIYTEVGKIASVGINIKKGIAGHGIAINICNDLSDFARIEACGVYGQPMDRVGDYHSIGLLGAFNAWCREFDQLARLESQSTLTSVSASL